MEREPKEKCPYCGSACHADFVDIGIGFQQCGPYFCENCKASSIGTYDSPRQLTPKEIETGWYAPGKPVSDKANTLNGKLVDHVEALELYRVGLLDIKDRGNHD